MRLNEYIEDETTRQQEQLLAEKLEVKCDDLLKRVNASEFKFYCDLLGTTDEEKPYLKKMWKQNKGSLKFINRNVPFGGAKRLLKDRKYDKVLAMMDDFDKDVGERKKFFGLNYNGEIKGVKERINKYIMDEKEKEELIHQHEELKKAQERARIEKEKEAIEQEKAERAAEEENTAMKLHHQQERIESDRLYAKQEELRIKAEEKEAKKLTRKEEINAKRKETRENNKKEKKIKGLVDEYKSLIQRRRELIDSADEFVDVEREKIKHDLDQLIMVAKKHEMDEGDLALRSRDYEKFSKVGGKR